MFLPVIHKANLELEEEIKKQGAASVQIDRKMISGTESGDNNEGQASMEDEGDEEDSSGTVKDSQQRTIQLEFALGDFDETPLAKAEDQMAKMTEKTKHQIVVDSEEESDDEEEVP